MLLFVFMLGVVVTAWRGERVEVRVPLEAFTATWQILFALGAVALVYAAWRWVRGFKRQRLESLRLEPLPTAPEGTLELNADRVRAAYQTWLRLLRDLELPRTGWQTPLEYARFVNVHHVAQRLHTDALTTAYERVRYGGTPSEGELEAVLTALEAWRGHASELERERVAQRDAFEVTLRDPNSPSDLR
jgi:hypothetical protein